MRQSDVAFEGFGERDPRKMPGHLFWGARQVVYATAERADIGRQNFTVCPRHWYVDATFVCSRCGESFVFTAGEQRFWYEELKFYVDSRPKQCPACRQELRELRALRQEYDRDIVAAMAGDAAAERKARLVAVVDALEQGGVGLPDKMLGNRQVLARQLEELGRPGGG